MSEALPSLMLVLTTVAGSGASRVSELQGPPGAGDPPGGADASEPPEPRLDWDQLRALVRLQQPGLRAPLPGVPGQCAVCHGPTGSRTRRCYPCELHRECAQGSLADVVVPVALAGKGGPHASHLWQYKSERLARAGGADRAGRLLIALLLVFLRDHGGCVWQAAGMPGPTHVAVVPSGRGRPGAHPLRALAAPYLALPWAELTARPGREPDSELDAGRFTAAPVPSSRVLLLDDTWTTGASAQSAAMALRQAGASSVATVVLGRHVGLRPSGAGPAPDHLPPFMPASCAVHEAAGASG